MSELTDDERAIDAHFVNPATPSVVSQANAMVQACAPAPWIAETEVYLEELGFDDPTRKRLMREKGKLEAKTMMMQLAQQPQEQKHDATMYEMANILKSYRSGKISRMNAITLFDRIGIGEDEAVAMLYDAGDVVEAIGGAAAWSLISATEVKVYTDNLNRLTGVAKSAVERAISGIEYDGVAELRIKLFDAIEPFVAASTDMAAGLAAEFYDSVRERAVGERYGAQVASGHDPGRDRGCHTGVPAGNRRG